MTQEREPEGVAGLLEQLRRKGVNFWTGADQLHYSAPKGALTRGDMDALRMYRRQIITQLASHSEKSTVFGMHHRERRCGLFPLAFSQLAHWHLHKLGERPAIRQIASAVRLRGRLHIDVLQRSLDEAVRRHEPLRTRIVLREGVPMQEIRDSGGVELQVDDLTTLPDSVREAEIRQRIDDFILAPVDLATGPLIAMKVAKIRGDEYVLIIAMEHIISDAVSLGILLRDILTAYSQILTQKLISLPAITVQFADFAVQQRNSHASWMRQHEGYWCERFSGCTRLSFGESGKRTVSIGNEGWEAVPLTVTQRLRMRLHSWSRAKKTSVVMGAFTAYTALVLRWCGATEGVIQFAIDGRSAPELQDAIGYFASTLYMKAAVLEGDNFLELLRRVTEEYCQAYEHDDAFYVQAQGDRPEFTRSPAFNWISRGAQIDLSNLDGTEDAIACSAFSFEHPMLRKLQGDNEPGLLLVETDRGISGSVSFPQDLCSEATIRRFSSNFLHFIEALIERPEQRIQDVPLI